MCSSDLTDALRSAKLSDADVPFTGKNVSDYIRSEYVTDENVLPEDIAQAADGMGIPAFLAEKLDGHFAMLRGDSDTPVRIESDEITGLLDQITESLHESCKLVIEDSDRQQISSVAEPVLKKVNAVSDGFGSTKAGRAFQRFGVSIWAYVLEVVLLALLIWRWCVIRKNSGKDIAGAFKGTGITVMIPAALSLILVLIGGIHTLFIRDDVVGLYAVHARARGIYPREKAVSGACTGRAGKSSKARKNREQACCSGLSDKVRQLRQRAGIRREILQILRRKAGTAAEGCRTCSGGV